ncbi:hypothetical protein Tco_0030833 [Tanacetum coccineum]
MWQRFLKTVGEHEESVSNTSNDTQLSGEDSMQLTDLMVLCTKLQTRVLALQTAKDAQAKEITSLKKRIQSNLLLLVLMMFIPTTNEEITLAQTLIQIKAAKPKVVTTVLLKTTTTTRPGIGVLDLQAKLMLRLLEEQKLSREGNKKKKPTP